MEHTPGKLDQDKVRFDICLYWGFGEYIINVVFNLDLQLGGKDKEKMECLVNMVSHGLLYCLINSETCSLGGILSNLFWSSQQLTCNQPKSLTSLKCCRIDSDRGPPDK